MNGETYSMQWMQRGLQHMKNSPQQLIIDSQREPALLDVEEAERIEQRLNNEATHYLTNGADDMQYIVTSAVGDVDLSSATLEQMAAENLIFMARDGQMEILSANDEDGTVVVSATGNSTIDCSAVMQQIAKSMLKSEADATDDGGTGDLSADCATSIEEEDHYTENYNDSTPQMVTEEVITDDWVQSQGEDRVEISAEQIIGSNSQVLLDMEEVPLPTVQDQYSALRPFPCDFCSRRFRKKASLMNHMVAHQTDRSLMCKLCGLRFSHRKTLINHLKAHADQEQDYDNQIMNFNTSSHTPSESPNNANYFHENDWQHEKNHTLEQNDQIYAATSSAAKTTRNRIAGLKPKPLKSDSCENFSQNGPKMLHNMKMQRDTQNGKDQNVFPVLDYSKPFVCQHCGLAFARQKALLSHIKTHSNDSPYECATCGDVFWDKGELQEHQRAHTFEESNSEYEPEAEVEESHSEVESDNLYGDFYCSECGLSFHRQDLLRRHAKSHCKTNNNIDNTVISKESQIAESSNNNHCCNTCGQTFDTALDLLAHAEIHTRYPAFKCVLCGETFIEENAIKNHLQTNHAQEMTQNSCILCGKECRDRRALIKHAWDHSREKCHTCSKCGKSFHNKARLKRHMASHRDKTVTCDVCHEEFPDGRTLSNHRHSHSTTSAGKLFPCNVCGKTFGSRSSQQIHVRIHTGERPYGCRYCWKAFADGGTLRKHERIHTGEKPYACSVCPRAFNQRVVLREHIRSHHSRIDVKRGTFYCSTCSAELPSSADLLQHLIEHSDAITAMQRQPVTGPRKYKRRRKLKPHELAKIRNEGKTGTSANTSDVDISELEMDQSDDIIDISCSPDKNVNNSLAADNQNQSRRRSTRSGYKKINVDTDDVKSAQEDTLPMHLDILDYMTNKKQRLDSTNSNCSEKLWPSSSSLLSNVENTLQTIETLVVSNKKCSNKETRTLKTSSATPPTTLTNTAGCQSTNNHMNARSTRKRTTTTGKNEEKNSKTKARMIYTEKVTNDNRKRGAKKCNNAVNITTTNMVVSDYEIISPAAQPPAEISSNNMSIKQQINNQTASLRADLFDAHLLLEASTLRKDQFEKFNPSIVNDLEEILRSPHKSGDHRRRFTSESSATQFLTEQSEEEQTHMIKIEPTSPDLRELISTPQSTTRSLRQSRELSINRKYLDFDTPQQHHTRLRTPSKHTGSRYLVDFGANSFDNPNVSPATSASDVTAAATAAAVAAEAAVSSSSSLSPEQRKTRYFECEMCSSIFTDRAQLLEHVNIHI